MKNLHTLIITAVVILALTSCSQIPSGTKTESQYSRDFTNIQNSNQIFESSSIEPNNLSTISYASISTGADDIVSPIEKTNSLTNNFQTTTNSGLISEPVEIQTVDGNYKSNSSNISSKMNINLNEENQEISKQANISDNSGKSISANSSNASNTSGQGANGVPYWLIVLCAIVIPPLGVALKFGIVDKFWICLVLTFCFWLPGMIYALIQVL